MTIIPICGKCKHLDRSERGLRKCEAFPDQIPRPILLMAHDHRKPFPSDHGIRFEPKSKND